MGYFRGEYRLLRSIVELRIGRQISRVASSGFCCSSTVFRMSGEEGRRGTWGDGATKGLSSSGRVGESLPVAKYFRLAMISQESVGGIER